MILGLKRTTSAICSLAPSRLSASKPIQIQQYSFSSLYKNSSSSLEVSLPSKEKLDLDSLCETSPHVQEYLVKLYKYLAAASVVGMATAQLFSLGFPLGIPPAYLVLAGFGLQQLGTDYIERTKTNAFTFKDMRGAIRHGTSNPTKRKFAFLSTALGYGCIIGSLTGIIPVSQTVLPLTAVACLFSTLGHLNYCKFAPKPQFKPLHLFISGFVTGVLGLNLMTSGVTAFLFENPLQTEGIELSTYIGVMLYNLFTGHDSEKAIEEVKNGKGDHLKHANKFSENWLYALVPHFLMSMY